jgi:uncharacterized membrane protein
MDTAQRVLAKRYLFILAIVLIGLLLRVYCAGVPSLDVDEAFSISIAKLSLLQTIQKAAADVHPPLYFVILHYWIMLNGDSEFTLRLLSIVFGVLAIPAIYLLGRLLYGESVGLLSALILAISAFNVQYSQEARMYSLMVVLTLLSMYFFVLFLRKGTLAVSAGYILVTTLLLYTHDYGLFVVLAQNIYVLMLWLLSQRNTSRITRWVILQAVAFALFAPWIALLPSQISSGKAGWLPVPTLDMLTATFVAYAASYVLLILFCALSVLAVFRYRKITGSERRKAPLDALGDYSWEVHIFEAAAALLLVIWLLMLSVVPFVISQVSIHIYWLRYTIAASVALYLLVAAGIRNLNWRPARLTVVAVIVILCAASLNTYYQNPAARAEKPQAREAFNILTQNASTGDAVIFFPMQMRSFFDYYYNNKTHVDAIDFPSTESVTDMRSKANSPDDVVKEVLSDVSGHDRVWFIIQKPGQTYAPLRQSLSALNESYKLNYSTSLYRFDILLYERRT